MTEHKKIPENEKNNTKVSSAINFFENSIIAGIIIAVLGFLWSSYFGFREKMLAKYEGLGHQVEKFIFLDEVLFLYCNQDIHKKTDEKTRCLTENCDYLKVMHQYKILLNMAEQFDKVATDVQALGGILSYRTYYQISELGTWNNLILTSDKGICGSGLLVSPEKMDKWRNNILMKIVREKEDHKSLAYSFKYYLLAVFTDIENYRYKSIKIDVNKLPIYEKFKE